MVTWEEQRTSTNSIVANNIARPKPEGRLVADVHKGKGKYSAVQHIHLEHGM